MLMSNQFKPGDLALTLVFDVLIPQGSQVELVERVQKGQLIVSKGHQFVVPSAGWIVTHPSIAPNQVGYGEGELMPLRGDFTSSPERAQELPA